MLGRGTLGACNSAGGEVEVCLLKILEEVSYFFFPFFFKKIIYHY